MVATFPEPDNAQEPLFSYLKRCPPQGPNIADSSVAPKAIDPFDRPLPPKRSRRRFYLGYALAHAAAVALGLWGLAVPQPQIEDSRPPAPDALWEVLGSDELTRTLQSVKAQEIESALTAAEQERLQAQQLRLEAEANAKALVDQAANRAREKTVAAARRADLIALDATYVGAEQVLYPEAGTDITLKFAARIQCQDGAFGETAVAAPVDSRIAPREVRNLAVCYPSVETAAGQPIGQAGDWGVAFFKVD